MRCSTAFPPPRRAGGEKSVQPPSAGLSKLPETASLPERVGSFTICPSVPTSCHWVNPPAAGAVQVTSTVATAPLRNSNRATPKSSISLGSSGWAMVRATPLTRCTSSSSSQRRRSTW